LRENTSRSWRFWSLVMRVRWHRRRPLLGVSAGDVSPEPVVVDDPEPGPDSNTAEPDVVDDAEPGPDSSTCEELDVVEAADPGPDSDVVEPVDVVDDAEPGPDRRGGEERPESVGEGGAGADADMDRGAEVEQDFIAGNEAMDFVAINPGRGVATSASPPLSRVQPRLSVPHSSSPLPPSTIAIAIVCAGAAEDGGTGVMDNFSCRPSGAVFAPGGRVVADAGVL